VQDQTQIRTKLIKV